MDQTVIIYDVTGGDTQISVAPNFSLSQRSKVSFQVQGASILTGSVTVQLQEANTVAGTYKDIAAGVKVVPVGNSDEYIDAGEYNGVFQQVNITVGSSTGGIITITLNHK